ncbi:hypothetical protein PHYPSEUDO_011794 [Phytophthora pseudosyringae]|uniref:Uncharacterized protein n=1 Tax=Phytophthora pseudosyringae TaxID=221518 RepID=A0A8T1W5Y4_9STRA|nr:hypothetical protein PHYPSEUDO_011794 [Phytophthora pseudosyringae]
MLSRRAATLALTRSAPALTRTFAAKPKIQVPVDKSKVHETPIVQHCGGDLMRWMGPGSRFQMYCALLLSGSLVYQADASANTLEVLATSGAICSASVTVFFGAKRLCDKVVTDIVSCRKLGDPDEFVRVSVLGVGVKEVLEASPKDFKLLGHDGQDAYSFAVGGRRLQLDTSTGECVNRKALDMLMQGRPLVTRKVKQGKKGARR